MIECLYLIGVLSVALPVAGGILYATLLWPLDRLWRWLAAHSVPDWLQLIMTFAIFGAYLGVIACIVRAIIGE